MAMPSAKDYVEGVLSGDRVTLARAITLVESDAPKHRELADAVVQGLLPHAGKSVRVGVTGVPGGGKSTFIEAFGCRLCDLGKRVAVLAIDPSSSISRGSILGDKTRMEELSRRENAFVRPSPSGCALGGVARKTRESILLCEAAGFDVVLVETVGVGQSETTVRSMVDFFLVITIAGAGDELQGIKKGIMELADSLLVTKADGDNRSRALATRAELEQVLHFITPVSPKWRPRALACSSLEGTGIDEVWSLICEFTAKARLNGLLEERRREQALDWMRWLMEQELWRRFTRKPAVAAAWNETHDAVLAGTLSPTAAAVRLLNLNEKVEEWRSGGV